MAPAMLPNMAALTLRKQPSTTSDASSSPSSPPLHPSNTLTPAVQASRTHSRTPTATHVPLPLPPASRNIVILLDGTANKYGDRNSNVLKLMSVLGADAESQLVYYSSGFGEWCGGQCFLLSRFLACFRAPSRPRLPTARPFGADWPRSLVTDHRDHPARRDKHVGEDEAEDRQSGRYGLCVVRRDASVPLAATPHTQPVAPLPRSGGSDQRSDVAHGRSFKHLVCDAYRFLMDFSKKGDKIYIFGFSRGAYAARALAGMLERVSFPAPTPANV